MQCSHCHWLHPGHSFLLPKCALGKLLVHWLMCPFRGYYPVPWNRWYCQLPWPWQGTSTSYSSGQKVDVAYTRASTTSCKSGPKRVVHYSLSAHRQFQRWPWNWSGQNRTSRTACYGHVVCVSVTQCVCDCMSAQLRMCICMDHSPKQRGSIHYPPTCWQ